MLGLDGHALHLDEPGRAADVGLGDDDGLLREALGKERTHLGVVRRVAQIDDEVGDVVVAAAGLAEQGLDVLPHATGLKDDVALVHHQPLVVDARRARDDHMTAVAVVDGGAALEGHAVVARAVQVGGRVEVVHLLGAYAADGVVVHLGEHVGILLSAADAGGGYEVGVVGQSLGEEHLVAGAHHAAVVQVDVVDEEPCAHAVVAQRAAFLGQLHDVLVEEQARLVLGVGGQVVGAAVPQMAVGAVGHLVEAVGTHGGGHAGHEVGPEGDLRAVEGWLLDDALGAVAGVGREHEVGLVGCVAEEVALEDGDGAGRQHAVQQSGVGVEQGVELLLEGAAAAFGVDDEVVFGYALAVGREAVQLGGSVFKTDALLHVVCFHAANLNKISEIISQLR